MKAKSEHIFNAATKIIAAYISSCTAGECFKDKDDMVNYAVELAMKIAEVVPDRLAKKKYDTSKLFVNFHWKPKGVTRREMEDWLRENTKYSSNRAMQTIINNALAEGVTHKDLKTGKYHQGPDGSSDDSAA
jgi:hypothetical protein